MSELTKENIAHKGRIGQIGIYLGKLFRMFVFQSDWKVLPMSAIIAGLVALVVAKNLYITMEGTAIGAFAISCVCIWNGCFNSIQSVCRERAIIKREHRAGLHMSSYVAANLIYQAFLCLGQSGITLAVLRVSKVTFPKVSYMTGSGTVDMFITIFLISYSACVLALFISSVVKNTTTAMTLMPFVLIFQLIFSGGFFELSENLMVVSNFTVSKWGLTSLCAQGNYNELPMVSLWNAVYKMKDYEMEGEMKDLIIDAMADEYDIPKETADLYAESIPDNSKPIKPVVYRIQGYDEEADKTLGPDKRTDFQLECAKNSQKPEYSSTTENIANCWFMMLLFIVIFAVLSTVSLEFIDKDRR